MLEKPGSFMQSIRRFQGCGLLTAGQQAVDYVETCKVHTQHRTRQKKTLCDEGNERLTLY